MIFLGLCCSTKEYFAKFDSLFKENCILLEGLFLIELKKKDRLPLLLR